MTPEPLVVVALAILAFGAVSRRAERSPVTPPMFFIAAGVLASEHGLGLFDVDVSSTSVHDLAELTLVIVLFTDASRIDLGYLRREESLPLRLLALGMPLSLGIGTLAGVVLLPGFGWVEAALLAAILMPTDAALGQAVVSNPLVPLRIRQTLNVESGLNDGIALPVVLVLASLAGAAASDEAPDHWLRFAVVAVVLGPVVGAAVGWAGARTIERGVAVGWVNAPFERLSSLGLAILAFAGAELVGGNGFIAAFVAGLMLGRVGRSVRDTLHDFAETEGQLLTLLVFLIFGAVLVPDAVAYASPATVAYALASLTVVRLSAAALALLGTGLGAPTLAFVAWFGPRGLASILFALVVVEQGQLGFESTLHGVVMLTVLGSALLHGATAYPLARLYGDRADAERLGADAQPMRVRVRHGTDE